MKDKLPEGHSLSDISENKLVFRDKSGAPVLTDAQHAALTSGIGAGKSMLVVSPTSTGKTQIAVWAMARAIENKLTAVYLVTHRALAAQKFRDLQDLLLDTHLSGNRASIVLATGDTVEDGEGAIPPAPLHASVLVATYEKYLALLSAAGVPSSFATSVICCDEIQLVGDETRGANVEVLLTLLKRGGWNQFIGLSAVLPARDSKDLASWLGVQLVLLHTREKHLRYECWSSASVRSVSTDKPDVRKDEARPGIAHDIAGVLAELRKGQKGQQPIIVFCMTKKQTYEHAATYAAQFAKPDQLSLELIGLPATNANSLLASYLPNRFALHNADLMDEERQVVERALSDGKLDVVFATSTLAAGVNFPLATALFAAWKRWDPDVKRYFPIGHGEFHNMAGRVGRMGTTHQSGRIVFLADGNDVRIAEEYLNLDMLPPLQGQIDVQRFGTLTLQLISSGICRSRQSLSELLSQTFSGLREQVRNTEAFNTWPSRLNAIVDDLVSCRFVIQSQAGALASTPVGKAVAFSGLLPATGRFLLSYAAAKGPDLVALLPSEGAPGDLDKLTLVACEACLSAPEFSGTQGDDPTRLIPYPLKQYPLVDGDKYRHLLAEPVWQSDLKPLNGAYLAREWMNGVEVGALESLLADLSAGMLRDLFRNLVWVLNGFANILAAATAQGVPRESQPEQLQSNPALAAVLLRLPWVFRRLAGRIAHGLPENCLWLADIRDAKSAFTLARSEIVALGKANAASPEFLMRGDEAADKTRTEVFRHAKPTPQAKSNWLRDTVRGWKVEERKQACERQSKRARKCKDAELVPAFYSSMGNNLEATFEKVLNSVGIEFARLDDKRKTGAPDYLVKFGAGKELVVELKSRDKGNLIDYNRSVEVLAASEVHGHKDKFCVTLCHLGVDPSVPTVIASCGRLSVVESADFGEALLRLCQGYISKDQVFSWLRTPGQPVGRDLPFRVN